MYTTFSGVCLLTLLLILSLLLYIHPSAPKDTALGKWVRYIRSCKSITEKRAAGADRQSTNTPSLSAARVKRLEALPTWQWHLHKQSWEENFDKLARYKAQHGDTKVPQMYKGDARLSHWIADQRVEKKKKQKGQSSFLTDEREARLTELGLEWSPAEVVAAKWDDHFNELVGTF